MKKRLYLTLTLAFSVTVLIMSSCLKDPRAQDFSNVGTLVELPLAAYTGAGNLTAAALPIQDAAQDIPVIVNVAAPKPLASALKVTLKLDVDSMARLNTKILNKFNADSTAFQNDTTGTVPAPDPLIQYALPPSDAYTISSLVVNVPANQHTGSITISVITSKLSLTAHYVVPLTIADASGQKISNYRTVFLNVQAKNKWDGIYSLKGFMHRDLDMTLGGPVKAGVKMSLATAGANSIIFDQVWANGGGLGGLNPVTIVINSSNQVTSITSPINTISSLGGYNNRYDPATKTFYLSIIWSGTDPNHRSAVDTLTYSGVR